MIRGKMKPYSIETRVNGTDEYGQPFNSYLPFATVDISISVLTKVLNNTNPKYIDSTHIGLTFDKSLKDGMKVTLGNESYMINIVNNDGRMAQLTLQEVL